MKNYYGNILVNEKDEFIRQVYKGNRLAFQEGFYSPIRQVERQVKIFESYMRDMDAITRTPIKSVVVFSNHRTVIHTKKASKKVKEKILRVDSLVEYIKQELTMPSPVHFLDNRMKELSHYIKASHFAAVNEETDAIEMKLLEETIRQHNNENKDSPVIIRETQTDLEELLKRFRKKLSAEQNVKAYYIFNNRTLEELIIKQPCTLNDLKDIYGIGEVKINEFGEELINIIKKYRQTHKSKAPYRSESGAK